MSIGPENLSDKFDKLQEQLAIQHTALLEALDTQQTNLLQGLFLIRQLLEGTATGNNHLVNSAIDSATRLGAVVTTLDEMQTALATANTRILNFHDDYSANNPLLVNHLFAIEQAVEGANVLHNSTNQTVGEIYVYLQECMPCGGTQEPGGEGCGPDGIFLSGNLQEGTLKESQTDDEQLSNRKWLCFADNTVSGMIVAGTTYYVHPLYECFLIPNHAAVRYYLHNTSEESCTVVYGSNSGIIGEHVLAPNDVCFEVPSSWLALAMTYNAAASGIEAGYSIENIQ
jgi:hypothetical protein